MNRSTSGQKLAYVLVTTAAVLMLGGCATKKSLREGLGTQDTKISGIESQVEANQKRIEETGQRLEGVKEEAGDAKRIGATADSKAEKAGARADQAYDLAKGKLLYTVVISEVAGQFATSKYELSDGAKKTLDDLAAKLKADNANVYLEVQGHTDGTGSDEYNLLLGQRRADAVRQYLNSTQGIPLHKMSVISFGKSKPVADNGTREGRAQNRRVEIHVLS
ncbi:MAG: OmpA family protein [Acidobacteria bacterium]|nr:OmpA family protein [Acidobacteriota bacterium]